MPLKVILAATGAENISLEAISAALKQDGHQVQLAFDRALFNDAQYFSIPWLARLLDVKDAVVRQIVAARPDLLCVSVFADTPSRSWQRVSIAGRSTTPSRIFGSKRTAESFATRRGPTRASTIFR
jgi:hypothetical protein